MTDAGNALVLVTGATGGFGAHMVEQFQAAGSRVVISDLAEAPLHRFATSLVQGGGQIAASIAADLSTADGARQLHKACSDHGLLPDIIVNNAGIALAGRLDEVPADRWESLMQINLLSPMRLCSLFLPAMIARGSGHIVNISSLAGWIGSPYLSAYCASKFGLRGFSEALAPDLDAHNIRVSTVYPSFSRTPILESAQFGFDQERRVPEHMLSEPADVVRRIIAGVEKNRRHIFPDTTARIMHYLVRYLPAAIPMLQRRLERSMERAG